MIDQFVLAIENLMNNKSVPNTKYHHHNATKMIDHLLLIEIFMNKKSVPNTKYKTANATEMIDQFIKLHCIQFNRTLEL